MSSHCVSTIDRNRNATARDIQDSLGHTQAFIELFPNLRVIVLCGRKAQTILRFQVDVPFVAVSEEAEKCLYVPDSIPILSTFHPGAQAYNRHVYRTHMQEVFRQARQIIRAEIGYFT